MRQLFPSATTFSPKGGDPPHIKAYNGQTLLGYLFWTTEILPLERGYGGPIAILIGLDINGKMTGLYVGEHHEPLRLAESLRVRRPEVPCDVRLGIRALLVPDDHHGPAGEQGGPADDGRVVAECAVPVELEKALEDERHEVERPRPLRVSRELDPAPGSLDELR